MSIIGLRLPAKSHLHSRHFLANSREIDQLLWWH